LNKTTNDFFNADILSQIAAKCKGFIKYILYRAHLSEEKNRMGPSFAARSKKKAPSPPLHKKQICNIKNAGKRLSPPLRFYCFSHSVKE